MSGVKKQSRAGLRVKKMWAHSAIKKMMDKDETLRSPEEYASFGKYFADRLEDSMYPVDNVIQLVKREST